MKDLHFAKEGKSWLYVTSLKLAQFYFPVLFSGTVDPEGKIFILQKKKDLEIYVGDVHYGDTDKENRDVQCLPSTSKFAGASISTFLRTIGSTNPFVVGICFLDLKNDAPSVKLLPSSDRRPEFLSKVPLHIPTEIGVEFMFQHYQLFLAFPFKNIIIEKSIKLYM